MEKNCRKYSYGYKQSLTNHTLSFREMHLLYFITFMKTHWKKHEGQKLWKDNSRLCRFLWCLNHMMYWFSGWTATATHTARKIYAYSARESNGPCLKYFITWTQTLCSSGNLTFAARAVGLCSVHTLSC